VIMRNRDLFCTENIMRVMSHRMSKLVGEIFILFFVLFVSLSVIAEHHLFRFGLEGLERMEIFQGVLYAIGIVLAISGAFFLFKMATIEHLSWMVLFPLSWITQTYFVIVPLYYFLIYRRVVNGTLMAKEGEAYFVLPTIINTDAATYAYYWFIFVPIVFLFLGGSVFASWLNLLYPIIYPVLFLIVIIASVYCALTLRKTNASSKTVNVLIFGWTLYWLFLFFYGTRNAIEQLWITPRLLLDISLFYFFFWGIWTQQGYLRKWQIAIILGIPTLLFIIGFLSGAPGLSAQ